MPPQECVRFVSMLAHPRRRQQALRARDKRTLKRRSGFTRAVPRYVKPREVIATEGKYLNASSR